MKINPELEKYIEQKIMPQYTLNDAGHNADHIYYVIGRSLPMGEQYSLNLDLLYVAAAYHDIGHSIDREKHELISAQIMYKDKELDKFMTTTEKKIVQQAIEDHRSSSKKEPRNLYGKVLQSADKNTSLESFFVRTVAYGLKHYPYYTKEEQIERVYQHAVEKFGKNGYATRFRYIEDREYDNFLKEIQELIDHKEELDKKTKEELDKQLKS